MTMEKLDLILEGMNELRQVTRAILDRLDENDAKLEALTMEVHVLKGDVALLQQDVAQLKVDVAELKQDVAQLKVDVAELKQDVTQLKVDVAELKDGQNRHERVLETLALRALEWNAYRLDQSRRTV
ncbi:hypothetical protein [Brevibacillus sp. SIMBA_040]|uniref:hypothetical protein n=1 Tax=unclassified Brevibacillus TaxID=2684853 RepID=UPI00397E0295